MPLTGLRLPCADPGGATDLDRVALRGVNRGDPVETVAAQIEQPTSLLEVGLVRPLHGGGGVFGMAAGEDHAVLLQQLEAAGVGLLVGDDVVLNALLR